MTSYASTKRVSLDYHVPTSESVAKWRRHVFIFPAIFIAMAVCFWFATTGDGQLFYREYFCGFYDAQARSILHGHLDVPPKAIGFEAFDHHGKTYGYFGVTPALLRIPLVIAFHQMDGRWSRLMMLIACGISLVCAYRLILHLMLPGRIETAAHKILVFLFVLCAGIGSTAVFLVSRSYVYHEAIMWGATFALLFADRLLAYLSTPSLGRLAAAGACAFLSFHARATGGAGALLAMCVLTVALIQRTASGSNTGERASSPAVGRQRRPNTNARIDAGEMLGLGRVEKPATHATLAALAVAFTVAVYLGINYAKFDTFQGVPVALYRMYTTNPIRMKITGGHQFHAENVPTGIASYFCGNGLSFGPEFPWIYMVDRARVLGRPALDVVEPYSGIPVSMPALFLLAVIGIAPVIRGKTQAMRRLRLPVVTLFLGAGVVLATVGITERYLHDFYPWLIVLGSAGLCRLMAPGHERGKIAVVLILSIAGIATNCAFAINFQRDYVWGEPQAKREEFVYARQVINRVLHRPPPPAVKEQP